MVKKAIKNAVKVKLEGVKKKKVVRKAKRGGLSGKIAPFAGVSQYEVAPVSIGNTLRSTYPSVEAKDGFVAVKGRDYVAAVGGISSNTTKWCLNGGFPLTPAALVASSLRGYFSSYQYFRFIAVQVHYITSSATSTSGDVLLLHHVNRAGPKVNHNSVNFLSFALSTKSAVLGPQWGNHSMAIPMEECWKETDVLNGEDLDHQSYGELLVYGNNTNASSAIDKPDSPGYVVMDYVVQFSNLMTNPRLLSLPINLFKWFNLGLRTGVVSPTAGDVLRMAAFSADGYTNVTSTAPSGDIAGYVYQIVLDVDSFLYNPNSLNLANCFSVKVDDNNSNSRIIYPWTTGATFYGVSVYTGLPYLDLYPTYPAALAGRPMLWSANQTNVNVGASFNLSLCGSVVPSLQQANIG